MKKLKPFPSLTKDENQIQFPLSATPTFKLWETRIQARFFQQDRGQKYWKCNSIHFFIPVGQQRANSGKRCNKTYFHRSGYIVGGCPSENNCYDQLDTHPSFPPPYPARLSEYPSRQLFWLPPRFHPSSLWFVYRVACKIVPKTLF